MHTLAAVATGIRLTLIVTASAFVFGVLGGIPIFFARRSRFRVVRAAARVYTELLRGIPPIVWLFLVYFGVGTSVVSLTPTLAAILGLGLITAAYFSEIYRGSVSAIASGQWLAAQALRLSPIDTWRSVVGPQLVRISLPAVATWAIGLLKDSSIASTIGVTEILYQAKSNSDQTGAALAPFIWAGLIYVALTIPLAVIARSTDRKLRQKMTP